MAMLNQTSGWGRSLLWMLLGVLAAGVFLEVGLRGAYAVLHWVSPAKRFPSVALGWETTPNLDLTYTRPAYGRIHYSTTHDGFRHYGNPQTEGLKLFVVGDSFTQATQVSDNATYYHAIEQQLPKAELFVYGSGGYGSLQEAMILERHWDAIQPDIIVWQFCGNDLINNDPALEAQSRSNNNHMTRPYDVDGVVERRFPARYMPSSLAGSYVLRHASIIGNQWAGGSEHVEERLTPGQPDFERSLQTTQRIFERIRAAHPTVPIVVFPVTDLPYERAAMARLCSTVQGVYCVNTLMPALQQAKESGEAINGGPHDAHWNARGHAIAGREIARFIREQELSVSMEPHKTQPRF